MFSPTILLSLLALIALFTFLNSGGSFLIFSILSAVFIIFSIFKRLRRKVLEQVHGSIDEIEGKTNLLMEESQVKYKLLESLPARLDKISFLFEASQRLIKLSDSTQIIDLIVSVTSELFPQADNVLFFTLTKDKLFLAKSLKRKTAVIKEKKGDVIDFWVLRNNQLILIDDLTKDFRFDYSRIDAFNERQMKSFVVSPLSIGDKLQGIIRVESVKARSFNLDDSRILRAICDLGVLVLERSDLFEQTKELAMKDSLTALYLRDYFFARFKEELRRAAGKENGIGLVMIDIDDFKKINDNYGHIVGDRVLKKLAEILLEEAGDSGDIVCRFGGEEFIFLAVETNNQLLKDLAQRIRVKAQNATVSFRRNKINFTVSIGLAYSFDHGSDPLVLVDKADHNLYKAKSKGKNRVVD